MWWFLSASIGLLAILLVWLFGRFSITPTQADAQRINALLPQTQCGLCGYAGCAPYAQSITQGESINKCPPGGAATIAALANLLDRPILPLDAQEGEKPFCVAFIREEECIGCTKCIQACPVDAILGAAQQMHTVLTTHCTGCDLCVAPCPVDCIDMLEPAALNAQKLQSIIQRVQRVQP